MFSIIVDGHVHYISRLDDFRDFMDPGVYEGLRKWVENIETSLEDDYSTELLAHEMDLSELGYIHSERECRIDDLEADVNRLEAQLIIYKDKYGEL